MQFTIYAGLLAISTIISGTLVWNASTRQKERVITAFMYLMIGVALWSGTYFFEAIASDLTTKIVWGIISGIDQIVPVLFLYFALQFSRLGEKIPVPALLLLFIIPVISFILSATFQINGLVWPEIYLTSSPLAGISLIYEHGAWYWVELVYNLLLYMAAAAALLMAVVRSPPIYSMQLWLVFLSSLFPFIGALLYAFASPMFQGIDLAPVSFGFTGIILYYAITRYLLFDLIPVAHEQILSDMREGVIVLDDQDRIVEMNLAAGEILPITDQIVGQQCSALPFCLPPFMEALHPDKAASIQIVEIRERWIEIRVYPIIRRGEETGGRLMICIDVTDREIARRTLSGRNQQLENMNSQLEREISERKKAEQSLQLANKKLNLLTGITRHDVLNWVTVINGYTHILESSTTGEKEREYLRRVELAGDTIREIISFTRTYEDMGAHLPQWIEVEEIFSEPEIAKFMQNFIADIRISGLQVYADLMFSKVFYNLMDNTLRHSGGARRITVSGRKDEEGYCLIYEDDGMGIPEPEKEVIFRQGYGKNSGLGMFLIREILEITGMTIKETGEPGSGAKFEISIPDGGYRFKIEPESGESDQSGG